MHVCPNCGYQNEETATICTRCNQALPAPATPGRPPPAAPAPQPPVPQPAAQAQDNRRKTLQFFLGLGLGLIPLIAFLLFVGLSYDINSNLASFLFYSILLLYIVSIIALIICLAQQKVRFVGYGLLTTVLASPVIGCIGCLVIVSSQHRPF